MLTQQQKDLLFGTLLGDGNLQTVTDGRTWRYRASHKKAHAEYLEHKYEILKSLCKTRPRDQELFDSRTQAVNKRCYFNTLVNPSLNFYANMFYTRNPQNPTQWIKEVPVRVEKFLTPQALAYFYMDDGTLKWLDRSNAMRICTENFSEESVLRLQKALQNHYYLKTNKTKETLQGKKIGYRIEIPETSSAAFREIIQPYLVSCMKYKVSDGNRFHL